MPCRSLSSPRRTITAGGTRNSRSSRHDGGILQNDGDVDFPTPSKEAVPVQCPYERQFAKVR
ncbi:hypothetical protein CR51_23160 [Caballeronia megalochromosomata]|nr:hypothetical protein CR51_23160 [Caballeronia megalochromosomata]